MVIVCDDPDRENEGDLCMAAEFVTAKAITFMACQARGLICLSLPEERCDELDLPLMVPARNGSDTTGFCVSIEAATGVTTGISAADRARTIQVAVDPAASAGDLVRPGHVFPLRARPRGVLERRGQTEAAVDLTRLAGLTPGGVLCEVMNDDGTMARGPAAPGLLPPAHPAGGHGRRDRDLPAQQRAGDQRRLPTTVERREAALGAVEAPLEEDAPRRCRRSRACGGRGRARPACARPGPRRASRRPSLAPASSPRRVR